ncbi:hypothetical protein GDN83_06995 [Gordonia jinghuaiqii]|uniref:Uncharacterized protein n=1 Tax=Gordonia jinghuaiqii TaxID=2758710 RepID=A0A7D7LYT1_9ACTN|nr:hypothetical protein [Gordonia jinghuaiqii]MCR5977485.1 hypothetical protein [Gordonia jinghuaiqii]QMT02176.1 hypothetical protein H1R19_03075 [Gordonia jinghuaiqii]
MGMTWTDWVRFVLAPLAFALIAAYVSTRNARKTPHERLKNLVDIHDKMSPEMDQRRVVEAAIARELVDFDRRVAADQRGLWAGIRERIAQYSHLTIPVFGFGGAVTAFVVVVLDGESTDGKYAATVAMAAALSALVGVIVSAVAGLLTKRPKKELSMERVSAQIRATLPRMALQDVVFNSPFTTRPGEYHYEVGERLEQLGVMSRADGPTGGSVVFSATQFGRNALKKSLEQADREHIAHWESVARESAAEGDEGDSNGEDGRGAPIQ